MSFSQEPQPTPVTVSFRWFDTFSAVLIGALSLALYVRTLIPYVLISDSAEFQVLGPELGMAHMPGYPMYIILAKLFTFLPIRDMAYRVNLFSAFMGAVTVAAVYIATLLLTQSRLAALFASLALTVSFTFWSQAIIAEVYTSGAACVALIWVGLLLWYRTGSGWALFFAGLCGGLSLGMHTTVALFAPAVVVFLILNHRRWSVSVSSPARPQSLYHQGLGGPIAPSLFVRQDKRQRWLNRSLFRYSLWLPAVLGAVAGVLFYLGAYAIVDSNNAPANTFHATYEGARSDWNLSEADLANPFKRFMFLTTATQWRSAMFSRWRRVPIRVGEYVQGLRNEFAVPTIVFILAGMILMIQRAPSLGWLFLVALLVHWVFTFTYQVSDIYVFYISGYVLMAMLAAYAAATLAGWLGRIYAPLAPFISAVALVALLGASIWPMLAPRWSNISNGSIPFLDARGYLVTSQTQSVYSSATDVVDQLPPNAIVFLEWKRLYTYYYAAHIATNRRDLRFMEATPHADIRGLPDSAVTFIDKHIADHPIFLIQPWEKVQRAGYRLIPRTFQFTQLYEVQKNTP